MSTNESQMPLEGSNGSAFHGRFFESLAIISGMVVVGLIVFWIRRYLRIRSLRAQVRFVGGCLHCLLFYTAARAMSPNMSFFSVAILDCRGLLSRLHDY